MPLCAEPPTLAVKAARRGINKGQTVRIKTFAASTTAKLDRKVNAFLARPDIEVQRLHAAMSFGTYTVVVEYDQR